MILNGRYTLSGGIVKYALPVIPLKEFNIENGSYVQWSGDPMDPYLNLTATERIRTNVTLSGQNPRMVNFDVGIALKQQLENRKGISSVQDHLALRGILERKVATPFEFDFAGAVGGNVGVQPYGLVDADGQQHIQAAQRQRGFLPASVHQRVFE